MPQSIPCYPKKIQPMGERSAASLPNAGFMSTHNDRCTYTKAILSDRGEQLTAFLTPESCLTTAYTWEDLKRSSSI
jgi:hypothetical protein